MKTIAKALIQFYQDVISPHLGHQCRFTPTCSQYSLEAFEKYHFLKAMLLSAKRIIRCNPLFKGGDDPLP